MRTTINVDDELLETLKDRAREENLSLTQVFNRAIRAGMEMLHWAPARRSHHREQVFSMGQPRVDLDQALALAAAIGDEETVGRLRLRK
jgi:hypothetical protein